MISRDALLERLGRLLRDSSGALFAFDGDGTLWTGDVGEDIFHAALREGLLKEAAQPALAREARAHGVDADGTSSEIASRLFAAYLRGKYPERDTCAMMTWCYAGLERGELTEFTRLTLGRLAFESRLHPEIAPILDFARASGVRVLVVSASPQPIVEQAVAFWGIPAESVAASRAELEGTLLLDRLAAPVPYAEAKPPALRGLSPEGDLIASFGDNAFDVELLCAARLGVAVRPKPALCARLLDFPEIVVLDHASPGPAHAGTSLP